MILTEKQKENFKSILMMKLTCGYSVDLAILDFMEFYISDDTNVSQPMFIIKKDFQEWLDMPLPEKSKILYDILMGNKEFYES